MENLILYYKPTCPYCKKVQRFMGKNGIDIEMRNIDENESIKNELIEKGGKNQVPCLLIEGKAMYESSDIIDYLKENLVK
ncbi:glutaredoxin [Citroniella saccharovorans]|uniref:Glutaredoxin n=1 Tax=Citroniella saccharovorans TaxID=2053367 RepID=A0AAW9MXA2_9FIRM|nr:glutaredoxin [Citroniella saccharovorans]MEB3429195.1 glutaredoxin [Citroniella saccharovorans]